MDIYTILPSALLFEDRASALSKLRDVAQALENLGVAGLCAGDHIVHYGLEIEDHIQLRHKHPDIFTFLAMIGSVTNRVRIVSRILVIPYRQPFAVAHSLATLDVMTGGRVVMGVGSGYATQEFDAFGIPFSERGARTDEYLRLIDLLWRQDEVDFSGKFFQCRGMGLLMRPMQQPRPPIWIGAHNRRAIQRAVELGDGWTPNCYSYPNAQPGMRMGLSRDQFMEERAWADEQRSALGKDRLECILSAGPVMDIVDKPRHAGRKREDIQFFTGTGTIDEILDEFSVFNECKPNAYYVHFSGETIERYLQNAKLFMENVSRHSDFARE